MTNEQKYKTTESVEKPEPCPFCGGETEIITGSGYQVSCIHCNYTSAGYRNKDKAVAAHNHVCRAVEAMAEGGEMSNERHETIADIVAEMLAFADTDAQTIGRDVLRRRIQHFARRIEAAWKREVAELRECLKEAIREKCPFTRMSCKHGEPCDYECETDKWRKALGEAGGEE